MRLLHYTDKPFDFDPKREYEVARQNYKPCGLWVSVEGAADWKDWCEGERFNLESLKHAAEVVLRPNHDIFIINTGPLLQAFHDRFKSPIYPGSQSFQIDWTRVKQSCGGVIIAPYRYEFRLEMGMLWYYGWDCASGCIWNLSTVERVNQDEEVS